MLRKLAGLLLLEFLVALNAGWSFHFFNRYAAGLWASGCFVALGLLILWRYYKWDFQSRSPLFWIAVAHTFVFAIPMFITRVITPSEESLQAVLFFPIEVFHRVSTITYLLMIVATVVEIGREIVRMRKKTPKI